MNINEKIKNLREELGITLEELSKEINVSIKTLIKYENQEVLIPRNNLRKISKVLGVTEEALKIDLKEDVIDEPILEIEDDEFFTEYKLLTIENKNKVIDFIKEL